MIIHPQHFSAILAGTACFSRGQLPILECALIQPAPGGLSITSTDLECQITATLPDIASPAAGFCVGAEKLRSIIRSCPSGLPLEIAQSDARAILRAGRSRWTLATLPADDFPALEPADATASITVPADDLHLGLATVLDAAARDDVRQYINGVLFEVRGGALRLVATDGHRLHAWETPIDSDTEARGIVPRRSAATLARLATGDSTRIDITPTAASFAIGETLFTTKLIAAKYPDWRRVLPKPEHRLSINRLELLTAVTRVLILANEAYQGIMLMIGDGSLALAAQSAAGDANDIVALADHGPEATIAVNGHYLVDALKIFGTEEIGIEYTGGNIGIVLTPAGADMPMATIMPMRL